MYEGSAKDGQMNHLLRGNQHFPTGEFYIFDRNMNHSPQRNDLFTTGNDFPRGIELFSTDKRVIPCMIHFPQGCNHFPRARMKMMYIKHGSGRDLIFLAARKIHVASSDVLFSRDPGVPVQTTGIERQASKGSWGLVWRCGSFTAILK